MKRFFKSNRMLFIEFGQYDSKLLFKLPKVVDLAIKQVYSW